MSSSALKVGVVGCGKISGIYLQNGAWLKDIEIVACCDLVRESAEKQAAAYGTPKVCTVEELVDDPQIDIVLNITVPHAHAPIALQALEAGKHVYGEKPLAVTREDGARVIEAAKRTGLRIGSAPDTFLGGAHQTCRKLIDDGIIGEPVSATAFLQTRGHESWHPSPEFYYQPGGGPMFDMGPYYLTALVNMFGPIKRVCGAARASFAERTITSEPKRGQTIQVNTPTHIAGTIDFQSGAIGTMVMSFDVQAHNVPRLEVHGTEGSMSVPDPNSFGQFKGGLHPIRVWTAATREWRDVEYSHGYCQNSRGVGVADMARAIRTGRPHRANGDLAYHVLDVMQAFLDSSEQERHVAIESTCQRPAPLPVGLTDGELDD
jgi:predicted dehydrogenase